MRQLTVWLNEVVTLQLNRAAFTGYLVWSEPGGWFPRLIGSGGWFPRPVFYDVTKTQSLTPTP